jgi:hypothetical protein
MDDQNAIMDFYGFGSSTQWHSEGQGFESLQLHQNKDVRGVNLEIRVPISFDPNTLCACYRATTGIELVRHQSGSVRIRL